jgi:CheY-like chemotaxis protein
VKRPSILIVDDEKTIADTLALILQDAGYTARAAYDGAAALTLSREHAPDLIISDVLMPGMSGVDLAVTTRREFPDCRILLFSGQAASVDMLENARSHGHDFELLAKPVDLDELLQRVTNMFT